jgi:hypothetical protein
MNKDRFKFRLPLVDEDGSVVFRTRSFDSNCETASPIDNWPVGNFDVIGDWEQCTGRKDKNDKLIFEGDILQGYDEWGNPNCVYVVTWCEDYCAFNAISNDKSYNSFAFCRDERWKEIIGNIHEKPKTIGGK